MSKSYTIAQARNNLGALVHEAEEKGPVELTRRGKGVAVVLSMKEYRRLTGKGGFVEAMLAFREKHKDDLSDEPWIPERVQSSGRGENRWS